MGSRQKVNKESISILRTCTMSLTDCKLRNPRSLRFKNSGSLAIPLWQSRVRGTSKQYTSRFNKNRPALFQTGTSVDA